MGTRHLIAVQSDGEYKVAQYGQWDGYPTGQGVAILEFLKTKSLAKFKAQLAHCFWASEEAIKATWDEFGGLSPSGSIAWDKAKARDAKYKSLSRDTGADILQIIQDATGPVALRGDIEFAGDSLFCEWAYVIDLDKGVFEVYQGFNKAPLDPSERFAKMPFEADQKNPSGKTYYPVKLLASFPLDNLPSKSVFLEACTEDEDEDEEETGSKVSAT